MKKEYSKFGTYGLMSWVSIRWKPILINKGIKYGGVGGYIRHLIEKDLSNNLKK